MKKLLENMDYSNFVYRVISSLFLISIITIFLLIDKFYFILLNFTFYMILFYEVIYNFKKYKYTILLYLLLSLISFQIFFIYFYDIFKFVFFILIIVLFDTFSYIMGSTFGKNKLIPNISPNKTYEGFLGGIFLSFFISFFYNLSFSIFNFIDFLIFYILIVIGGFFGDLIESYFKRVSLLKNSSNILPGHGGLFDRFDSVIFAIHFLILSIYLI